MQKAYDPLLGHGYGRYWSNAGEARNYRDRSGQAFWEELTGDPDFYIKLIALMRNEPLKYKEEFQPIWAGVINKLTLEFSTEFCQADGRIDWVKLVQFVSAKPIEKPIRGSAKKH
jgi:hypothetical protein